MRVFVAAKRSPEAEQYARKIVEESGSLGMEKVSRPEDADAIIVAGGDGTLLKYVKYGIPVLGIKFGRRSKLLEVEPEEGERALRRLIKGDYVIDEYPLLEVEMRGEKFLAFNEVALIFDGSETIVASVSFEGETITFEGDGVIIATPQGSWAWGFSATGVVVHKNVDSMELILMNPLSPLGLKAVILPPVELTVRLEDKGRDQKSKVVADGEILGYFSKAGEGFKVRKSERRAKLIRFGQPIRMLRVWR